MPAGLREYPCRVLARGWDSYQEAWNWELGEEAREEIRDARRAAEEDPRRETPASLTLGGEEWQVPAYGAKGGVLWRLQNPDMIVMVRHPDLEWCVSVRYRSAGLWQWGLPNLRERTRAFLAAIGKPRDADDDEPVVSRADYAVDMHAPAFRAEASHELAGRFVLARGQAKIMTVARTDYVQTYTIGSIARLQVQLYDKTAEIREASGKDWLEDHWGGLSEDVWRVEIRMSGDWLKERGIRGYHALADMAPKLLSGALVDRRLTAGDQARTRRAAVHPLWWRAIEAVGAETEAPMVCAYSTLRPAEFRELMVRQIGGTLRSVSVAGTGDMTGEEMRRIAAAAMEHAHKDRNLRRKVEAARERHRWMDRPA